MKSKLKKIPVDHWWRLNTKNLFPWLFATVSLAIEIDTLFRVVVILHHPNEDSAKKQNQKKSKQNQKERKKKEEEEKMRTRATVCADCRVI